jgi:uncharacterized membrane protein
MTAPRVSAVDSRLVAVVLLGVTVLTGALVLLDTGGVVRLVLTVAFFLLVPGWAVVALARPRSALSATALAVAVAVSVSVELLAALTMVLTGTWHPGEAFAVLAGASAVLLVVHLIREAPGE